MVPNQYPSVGVVAPDKTVGDGVGAAVELGRDLGTVILEPRRDAGVIFDEAPERVVVERRVTGNGAQPVL